MAIEPVPQNPQVESKIHIAAAALPLLGAFTANVAQELPRGSDEVALVCTYTKPAASALGAWKLEVGWEFFDAEGVEAKQLFADVVGAVAATPIVTVNALRLVLQGPSVTGAGVVTAVRVLTVKVPPGATKVRVVAAETGDLVNVGTLSVRVVARKRVG